jgi:hypothetical protein
VRGGPRTATVERTRRAAFPAAAACCLLALGVLSGCSAKPPVLSRVYARVIYVKDADAGVSRETLGVFLVASDADGMENLSAFYVINDDAELFWKVDSSSWVTSTAEGETWIGSNGITMPAAMPLPSGTYRVVLQDVGGETAEDTFTVPTRTRSASNAAYPTARVANGKIRITGTASSGEVWAYGRDGKFAASVPVTGASPLVDVATIAALSPALAAGFSFRVFSWDERAGYGVLSETYQSGSLPSR